MSLGDVLGRLFGGAAEGFETYLQYQNANEEKVYRRKRDAIEDSRNAEADQAKWREQSYQHQKDKTDRLVREAEQSGIQGVGSALEAMHAAGGNQVQGQAGTGEGTLVPNALKALQAAREAPDFDPRKQYDTGGGTFFQGPDFAKAEPKVRLGHYTGADNRIHTYNLDTGEEVQSPGGQVRVPRHSNASTPQDRTAAARLRFVSHRIAEMGKDQPDPADPYHVKFVHGLDPEAAAARAEQEWEAANPTDAPAVPISPDSKNQAADEWDDLVNRQGLNPDEATARVKAKYRLQ